MDLPGELVDAVRGARRIAVLTGAGVSAESGLSTFRGPGGLWENQDLLSYATPEGFARDPQKVWEWYQWRRGQALLAQPNAGHRMLAGWESRLSGQGGRFDLLTQNVDGLHQAAGSKNVIELHGSGWTLRCMDCGREEADRTHPFPVLPPKCPACRGMLRPGVVWFGEQLPLEAAEAARRAALACEFFLVAGTSGTVYPAASYVELAAQAGAKTLEVNLEPTPLSGSVHWSLRGKSGEILPRIFEATK